MWSTGVLNTFKKLPGHERQYVPISEYLFKVVQPSLDDLLFLGTIYETLFDRFEVFFALAYADLAEKTVAPLGRYAWKHSSRLDPVSPYDQVLEEAKAQGQNWPPFKAGLFGGSLDRFLQLAQSFRESLNRLSW
jgi:hypothetical protein